MLIIVFLVTCQQTENEFYDALTNLPSVQFHGANLGGQQSRGEGEGFRVEKGWTNTHLSN